MIHSGTRSDEHANRPARYRAELMDQAEYLDRAICNQQIQCVMELDGVLDVPRLNRAIRRVTDLEPVLGCRFVESLRGSYWERREDLEDIDLCTLEERSSDADRESRLRELAIRPADPRTDPLVEAHVLRAKTDTVLVRVDHIAADTGGTKECLGRICEEYSRDAGEDRRPPPAGSRGLGQVLSRFSTREKLRALRHANPGTPAWGFPFRGKGAGDRAFAVRRIDPDGFTALRAFASRRGATVNDCLLAACYRAFSDAAGTTPGTECTVRVPIDLRRYIEGGKAGAVCNLTGQMYPRIARVEAEAFGGTVNRARDAMNRLKACFPGIGAAIAVGGFMLPGERIVSRAYRHVLAGEYRTLRCDPYLSNMGVLPAEKLTFGDVGVRDAYLFSPLQWAPGFLLGASTFENRLTLTVGYADADLNAGAVERFMEGLRRDLLLETV